VPDQIREKDERALEHRDQMERGREVTAQIPRQFRDAFLNQGLRE
jgi:hypothetical protein